MSRLLSAAIIVAVGLSLAVPAAAHEKKFRTRVTNSEPTPGNYEGQVFSRSKGCVRNRELKIWRDQPGPDDEYLNTFRADSEGRWEYHFLGEEYYVTAKRIVKGSGRHRHTCRTDRSPTI